MCIIYLVFGSTGFIAVQPVQPIEPWTRSHTGSISGLVLKTLV